eukprot:evm.model.scf_1266.1 EVM.evm.TU.scf_1266.1   scf_1266:362-4843(+)
MQQWRIAERTHCRMVGVRPLAPVAPGRGSALGPVKIGAPGRRRGDEQRRAALSTGDLMAIADLLKNGTATMGAYLEQAPPMAYYFYLLGAGFGLPFSEDALVAWIGSRLFVGFYQSWVQVGTVLAYVYAGVVLSDMITFALGSLLKRGFLQSLKKLLIRDSNNFQRAVEIIQKWSGSVGAVQRFSLGFRGPLCLISGFMGVDPAQFALGAALAAPLTIAAQLSLGYIIRDCGNVYLTTLALVAGPNLVGHTVGPVLTATWLFCVSRAPKPASPTDPQGA